MNDRIKNGIAVLIVALYMLLPADVVNDAVPILGQIDDVLVAVIGMLVTMGRLPGKKG